MLLEIVFKNSVGCSLCYQHLRVCSSFFFSVPIMFFPFLYRDRMFFIFHCPHVFIIFAQGRNVLVFFVPIMFFGASIAPLLETSSVGPSVGWFVRRPPYCFASGDFAPVWSFALVFIFAQGHNVFHIFLSPLWFF
jgi:hypothetical protein